MLSPDQVATFEEDGFLVVRQLLDDAILQPVRQVAERVTNKKIRSYQAGGKIQNAHPEAPFETRWAIVCRENELTGTQFWGQRDLLDQAFYNLHTYRPLTDVVASLLGPDLRAHGDFWVRPKIHDPATTLAWHQDSFYYGGSTSPTFRVFTVWMPLVDVDEGNGCLRLVRGSHRHGAIRWHPNELGQLEPVEAVTGYGTPVTVPMQVGDVLIISNLTLHASGENTTGRVRWSTEVRYTPADQSFGWHGRGNAFDAQYPTYIARSTDSRRLTTWSEWRDRWTAAWSAQDA